MLAYVGWPLAGRLHIMALRNFTWRIANLCISWSLHAGIISLSTPNSSFIFDLRLRSMTECAVFLAIFFPAALVKLGCFLLAGVDAVEEGAAFLPAVFGAGFGLCGPPESSLCFGFGFIWMILRERVGGGGREKSALVMVDCECRVPAEFLLLPVAAIAGGGRRKDISSDDSCWVPFWPVISVDDAGVGGRVTRGITEREALCQEVFDSVLGRGEV